MNACCRIPQCEREPEISDWMLNEIKKECTLDGFKERLENNLKHKLESIKFFELEIDVIRKTLKEMIDNAR